MWARQGIQSFARGLYAEGRSTLTGGDSINNMRSSAYLPGALAVKGDDNLNAFGWPPPLIRSLLLHGNPHNPQPRRRLIRPPVGQNHALALAK
jgi:hypothetical protein